MNKEYNYSLTVKWTGNTGAGTSDYKAYERSHSVLIPGKPEILSSSDAAFRGDPLKHNPEELLLASVSSCHMLWFLHVCAEANVIVVDYSDNATGTMIETANGSGHFKEIILHPVVTVTEKHMAETANALHKKANEFCFIANSLNFKVLHEPVCKAL